MSMKPCPECQQSVSDMADNCLHCGYPLTAAIPQVGVSANSSARSPLIWIGAALAGGALVATLAFVTLSRTSAIPQQAAVSASPSAHIPSESELKAKSMELEIEKLKLEQAKLKQGAQSQSNQNLKPATIVVQAPAVQVTPSELQNLDCRSLWILRNSIYARYGRIFQSPEVRAHFNQQPWYRPNSGYHDGLLSQTEKRDAASILSVEKQFGCL